MALRFGSSNLFALPLDLQLPKTLSEPRRGVGDEDRQPREQDERDGIGDVEPATWRRDQHIGVKNNADGRRKQRWKPAAIPRDSKDGSQERSARQAIDKHASRLQQQQNR